MKDKLQAILTPHDQQHVLDFWDTLDAAGRQHLADQIASLDLELIEQLYRAGGEVEDLGPVALRAAPPPAIRLSGDQRPFSAAEARECGQAELRAGHVAAILVAGGQGTRLGFPHPKGMYPVGPLSGATLFQIFIEQIRATAARYGAPIPLYVMTSPATDEATREFFDRQQRYGLDRQDLIVFCQGTMPAVDAQTGHLLLADRGTLCTSPDGHGGMLAALQRSGTLDEMHRRGLKHLFYFQVDNPLATVCEPEFLGSHVLANSEYSLQVVAKRDPLEKVGNVVQVDGVSRVIEYSDLPLEAAERRNDDGSLVLWAGSIAVHAFDLPFLRRVAEDRASLPFHRACKKVSHLDGQGQRVQPAEPNAIKFERFIFDLLPLARRSICIEVDPAEAFAPVKNAPRAETDTAEIAQQMMMALHRRWLREAGATVDDQVRVEISPLFASDPQQLATKIPPGSVITQDTYFHDQAQGPPQA
ncbi:MAG: UDPGP type 1 family protein [Planctomycetales bacterium]|nr:UDPGP type 1 family protein [Planctomycetales bacterium]